MTHKADDKDKYPIVHKTAQEKFDIISARRARIVLYDTSLAGLLTFIPCVVVDNDDQVAYTNGAKIFLANRFWGLERDIQCGVIIHEMLHIALRHIQRHFKHVAFPQLMNIATDAVINHSLKQQVQEGKSWCALPDDCVQLEKVIDEADRKNVSNSDWDSGRVYNYLLQKAKDKLEQQKKDKGKDKKDGDSSPGSSGSGSSGSNGNNLSELEKAVQDLLDELREENPGMFGDLQADEETKETAGDTIEDAKWENRVRKAVGTNPNSLLGKVLKEFPEPKTPWTQVLKRLFKYHCMPTTIDNWNRPGRSMIATRTRIFHPGIKPKQGLRNAVVIIDTSGSVFSEEEQKEFAAEIQGLQQQTGVTIHLIYADSAIQAEYKIDNDGKTFKQKLQEGTIVAKGGGGTDMTVPIKRAKELKSVLTICATDGYTPFPEPKDIKGMNMIWLVNTEEKIPDNIGVVLRIN